MISNIKILLRQLTRHTTFTTINLTGLILGITACLYVAQFVYYEYSFENFNEHAERTYRLNLYNTSNGEFEEITPNTVSGLAYSMNQSLTGIEAVARVSGKSKGIVSNPEDRQQYLESGIVSADESIFDLLGIEVSALNKAAITPGSKSVAISRSTATRYFGTANPLGKTLDIGFNNGNATSLPYQVTCVFTNIPPNSHQQFDIVVASESDQRWNENWDWSNVTTYVRLQNSVAPEHLESGLAGIVKLHHQDGAGDKYLFEPLRDIRLHALDGSGRATMVNIFIVLGVVILSLAWLNYISLSTARFLERMKEVGVRKLLGAGRRQLVLQLLTESLFFNTIAFAAAVVIVMITWPWIASGFNMPSTGMFLQQPVAFAAIPLAVLLGTLLSGFYPSLFLSSFKPIDSIKGKLSEIADRTTLRKVLVIVQLSISVMLITAIVAIEKQLKFMQGQDIGINIDRTLIIEEPLLHDATSIQQYEPFKNEVSRIPSVKGVTYASTFAGSEIDWHRTDFTIGSERRYDSRVVAIGTDFLDVFGLTLLGGRNFIANNPADMKTMLINEEAMTMFGFKNTADVIGKIISMGTRQFEVIGVVKNYHFRSFQHGVAPMLFLQGYPRNPNYAIKIGGDHIPETIAAIEAKWKAAYHGNAFQYHFLDEKFGQQYASEQLTATIIGGLTVLAVIISFLGLFGLSVYAVSRRTKEIGIRKVMGATVTNIVMLLSRDFVKLAVVAGLITMPFVYQGLKTWLGQYAYQMSLDIWLFVLPFLAVTLLTAVAISFKTFSAARTNPSDTIRYE